MKKIYQNKSGFTMIEILVAVIIIISLVAMAMPLYDRAIEKSRVGEASITLKRIGESKLRIMSNRDISIFLENTFYLDDLDTQVPRNNYWAYGLFPVSSGKGYSNAVCAKRISGKNKDNVVLTYLGEVGEEYCNCSTKTYSSSNSVCGAYCRQGTRLFCRQKTGGSCETYGMDSISSAPYDCKTFYRP